MSTLKIIQGRSKTAISFAVTDATWPATRSLALFFKQSGHIPGQSSLSTNTSSPWLPQNHFSAPLEHSPASLLLMSGTLPPPFPAESHNPHQVRHLRRARPPTSVSERSPRNRRRHSVGISFLHVNKLIIITKYKSLNVQLEGFSAQSHPVMTL